MSPGLHDSRWRYWFKLCAAFAAPAIVLVALMDVIPFPLALYVLLVLYGFVLAVAFLSRIRSVGSITSIRNNDPDDPQYYGDMSRALSLAISVGSASNARHPSDSSRREIARIVRYSVERYHYSNDNDSKMPPQVTGRYDDALGPLVSRDLEGVLSPYVEAPGPERGGRGEDGAEERQGKKEKKGVGDTVPRAGDDGGEAGGSALHGQPVRQNGTSRPAPPLRGGEYLSCLERVVAKLEERDGSALRPMSPPAVAVG